MEKNLHVTNTHGFFDYHSIVFAVRKSWHKHSSFENQRIMVLCVPLPNISISLSRAEMFIYMHCTNPFTDSLEIKILQRNLAHMYKVIHAFHKYLDEQTHWQIKIRKTLQLSLYKISNINAWQTYKSFSLLMRDIYVSRQTPYTHKKPEGSKMCSNYSNI